MTVKITPQDVLLVIDLQKDFCPGGALAVPQGDEILPLVNWLVRQFPHVVLTQDWHPKNHLSFASNHPGRSVFDTIETDYGMQTLWPDHCVQGSEGAEFHPALDITRAQLILRKGFHRDVDSYSAFQENDRITKTGLTAYLHELGLKRVFLAGLAYDYCVRYSAVDGKSAGFEVVVIEDACRAMGHGHSVEETRREFMEYCVQTLYCGDLKSQSIYR